MTYPTVFANLAAGNQNASLLDTMYNIVGNKSIVPCTVTGTASALTLTPVTNFFLPASYVNYQYVTFVAALTSTGSVTAAVTGLAAKKVFKPNLVQASTGDLVIGQTYLLSFNSVLDAAAGGWVIMNAAPAPNILPVQSMYGLQIGPTTNTSFIISATEIVLESPTTALTQRVSSPTATISTAASGANGLDTGAMANNTWYFVYGIYNANTSTFAGMISVSQTIGAITLPSGYTYAVRLGAVKTATASTNLMGTLQVGSRAQYLVGIAQTTTAQVASTGVTGNPSVPTYSTISLANFIPPTAQRANLYALAGTGGGNIILAPNNSYGGIGSLTNAPPVNINSTFITSHSVDIVLESASNVFYASNATNTSLFVLGWTDGTGGPP